MDDSEEITDISQGVKDILDEALRIWAEERAVTSSELESIRQQLTERDQRIKELEGGQEPVALRWVTQDGGRLSEIEPLYSKPTPSPNLNAAVAAALVKAEEVCPRTAAAAAAEGMGAYAEMLEIATAIKEGISYIPRDTTALREFGMKVADSVWGMYCNSAEWTHDNVRAIVDKLIKGE